MSTLIPAPGEFDVSHATNYCRCVLRSLSFRFGVGHDEDVSQEALCLSWQRWRLNGGDLPAACSTSSWQAFFPRSGRRFVDDGELEESPVSASSADWTEYAEVISRWQGRDLAIFTLTAGGEKQSAIARALGIGQATVSRRLSAIESRLRDAIDATEIIASCVTWHAWSTLDDDDAFLVDDE